MQVSLNRTMSANNGFLCFLLHVHQLIVAILRHPVSDATEPCTTTQGLPSW